ncbi:hypothetical protein [Devosia submarina]|uniref:hypothetical protein n=1 Tax=Devosia submarina TaxID=1173082 RepID=UPI0013001C61|nr:hypothetical protein [Devosia submarina]
MISLQRLSQFTVKDVLDAHIDGERKRLHGRVSPQSRGMENVEAIKLVNMCLNSRYPGIVHVNRS